MVVENLDGCVVVDCGFLECGFFDVFLELCYVWVECFLYVIVWVGCVEVEVEDVVGFYIVVEMFDCVVGEGVEYYDVVELVVFGGDLLGVLVVCLVVDRVVYDDCFVYVVLVYVGE